MVYEQLGLKIDCKRERERERGLLSHGSTSYHLYKFYRSKLFNLFKSYNYYTNAIFTIGIFSFLFFFMVLSNDEKIEMLWTAVNLFPIN